MVFLTLRVDKKGRIHVPVELRDKLGLASAVRAETRSDSIVITPLPEVSDPLKYLLSLNLKDDHTPLEMKKAAQKAMAGD